MGIFCFCCSVDGDPDSYPRVDGRQGQRCVRDSTHTTRKWEPGMAEEETRFFGLKRECGLHEG
ncbi:hypothetical protein DIZ31_16415 [Escherichia coli]|nr:hypothetical protein DIZ31_16415 [Escherichia coli]